MISIHERDVAAQHFSDRWSKDLIGTEAIPTTSGFNLGRANYTSSEFGPPQIHADQEAVYVISGEGEMCVGEEIIRLEPGVAFLCGAGREALWPPHGPRSCASRICPRRNLVPVIMIILLPSIFIFASR